MKINKSTYLTALGLWHLATQHQKKALEFETELNKLFGLDNGSQISDGIYGQYETLDECLKREGIEVENADS